MENKTSIIKRDYIENCPNCSKPIHRIAVVCYHCDSFLKKTQIQTKEIVLSRKLFRKERTIEEFDVGCIILRDYYYDSTYGYRQEFWNMPDKTLFFQKFDDTQAYKKRITLIRIEKTDDIINQLFLQYGNGTLVKKYECTFRLNPEKFFKKCGQKSDTLYEHNGHWFKDVLKKHGFEHYLKLNRQLDQLQYSSLDFNFFNQKREQSGQFWNKDINILKSTKYFDSGNQMINIRIDNDLYTDCESYNINGELDGLVMGGDGIIFEKDRNKSRTIQVWIYENGIVKDILGISDFNENIWKKVLDRSTKIFEKIKSNTTSEKLDFQKNEDYENIFLETLGLGTQFNFEIVKNAYHSKVKQYHPDKVAHLGVEFQTLAKQKTQLINEAYEYFKKKYGE